MRKNYLKFFLMFSLTFYIMSCDSGPKPIEIQGMDTYVDQVTKFSVKYPKNWVSRSTPGARYVVVSDQQVSSRFAKYDTDGFPGAKIDVTVNSLDSTINIDTIVAKSKIFDPSIYQDSKTNVDGIEAFRLDYSFPLNNGMFNGIKIIGTKDNKRASVLTIECFDGTYEKYKNEINDIISSFKFALAPEKTVDTITEVVEADPPSATLNIRQGDGFTIGIPDNFGSENIGKSGNALKSFSYLGKRRGDSYIQIEIFDSKKKELKKIVDELKGSLKGASAPQKTTLGGKEAYLINYTPSGSVGGKAYFAINNDKLYRVIINWFKGEEKDFLPVFEKSVQSFRF